MANEIKLNGSADSIIEKLLSTDPANLSTSFVLKTIFGENYEVPDAVEIDPEKEFQDQQKLFQDAVDQMVKSLDPKPLSVPIGSIEDLSCKYEGDEFYSEVLKLIYSQKNPIKTWGGKKTSSEVEKEISSESEEALNSIKEEIFDNLDPSIFGKPSNFMNKKSRTINVLGFPISFDIIMSGGKPVHFSLKPTNKTIQQAVDDVRSSLNSKKAGRKPCENQDTNEDDSTDTNAAANNSVSLYKDSPDDELRSFDNIEDSYAEDSRDFLVDEPPLVNDIDCDPPYPQDFLTGEPLFKIEDLIEIKEEICADPVDVKTPDIVVEPDPVVPDDIIDRIDECLKEADNIQKGITDNADLLGRFIRVEQQAEEIYLHYKIVKSYFDDLLAEFDKVSTQSSGVTPYNTNSVQNYISQVRNFSVRFNDTSYNSAENPFVRFTFSFPTLKDDPTPYEEIDEPQIPSLKGDLKEPTRKVKKVDQNKIRIGQEYLQDGILFDRTKKYFDSVGDGLRFIHTGSGGSGDVAEFYDFVSDVISSGKSKDQILLEIETKRGFLYGRLIERSAMPWIFFTPEERGDNDARDPSKLRPSSLNPDGSPNQIFLDFWSNYKEKWDAKYQEILQNLINPRVDSIILSGKSAAAKNAVDIIGTAGARDSIVLVLNEITTRYNEIENLILYVSERITTLKNSLSGNGISGSFANLSCAGGGGPESAAPAGETPYPRKSPECPPPCCGPAGSDFAQPNYLQSPSNSSDCPTIYQKCWWKEFSKNATLLGLLPYPNGLPPVEDISFFLASGPSVRFGFRYWPVGYLPPAIIPISPLVNPIDGQPFIRIPLPMIWTIVDPIVIPLPFNLGLLVIFIPFIGGFMPSPLVYIRENLFGTSLFLTGLRGPRFIPRKSDPKITDPLQKIKEKLTHGIPEKLIPLPGFGLETLDSPSNIVKEISTNLNKIMDRVEPPRNVRFLTEAQERERSLKSEIDEKRKEYKKRAALYDDEKPDDTISQPDIDQLIDARKKALAKTIKDFFNNKMTPPRDIRFPKDKDKLKFDLPSVVNFKKNIDDIEADLTPSKSPEFFNLREEMRFVLKNIKLKPSSSFDSDNQNLTNPNSIIFSFNGNPISMNEDQFLEVAATVKNEMILTAHKLMKGDKKGINGKIREGAFSVASLGNLQGAFKFPEIKVTEGAPGNLKFNSPPNPILEGIYIRIMTGVGSVPLLRSDFAEFTRTINGEDKIIMRVKDFKRLLAKKMGLGKTPNNDPVYVENAIKNPTDFNVASALKPLNLERSIIDREEPIISKFPNPQGVLSNLSKVSSSFGSAFSAFEFPLVFPPKQDQISQSMLAGGIPQIIIPGSIVKTFLSESISGIVENNIDKFMPEINDIDSSKFMNLNSQDIVKLTRNMINETINPNGSIPPFLSPIQIPVLPHSRPTGIAEMALMSMGVPPFARIPLSLLWKYWVGVPKIPLADVIVNPIMQVASKILSFLPWPIIPLLGRNLINIISPIALSDDLPDWKRLSLKNAYFVVYLDEFLRSAADVSGLFKFCFGTDLIYPIPELPSEIQKALNVKKFL